MDHVAALLAVAALVTAGVFGAVSATGGGSTFSKAICYAVGILVPMPLVFDIMKGHWPPGGRRALVELIAGGVLLTGANSWIFLGDSRTTLVALAVPMGLVIWSAARGGLAPASAALFNLTVFASLSTTRSSAPGATGFRPSPHWGSSAHSPQSVSSSGRTWTISGKLASSSGKAKECCEAFREIADAARRAVSLTRQLLAFSRKQILQPRVIDLNELVSGTEKMLRRMIGEDIKLRTRLRPGLASVMADPGQIEQIMMNLAVNARDAMPRGGELFFETENIEIHETHSGIGGVRMRSGRYVKLTVADNGEGMDEETLARVFEPFFTTKEKGKGTGLGLSTVYGIVKQSGGYIWARSAPAAGTSFDIFFPQIESEPEPREKDPPSAASKGGETVLVVEDEEVVLKLARSILERSGYKVITAKHGADALRIVEKHAEPLHLLLTDVVMPGMSGRVLADGAKSLRHDLRVLFTSGYTDDAIVHHGVLDAGTHLLEKPYSRKTLLAAVRKALDGI